MKTIKIFIFLLVVSMAIASCSKDDETSSSVSGNKYGLTYLKQTVDGVLEYELKTRAELDEYERYQVIEFKTDGKFYMDAELQGTWTQSGSSVTVDDGTETTTGTINGNVLKITSSFEDEGEDYVMDMQFTKI